MFRAKFLPVGLACLIAGCGSAGGGGGASGGTAPRRSPPPIAAGAYSGTQICMNAAAMNGGATSQPAPTNSVSLTIGGNGLPVENGKEVAVGDTGSFSLPSFSGTSTVTSVTRTDTGAMVAFAITISISPGGGLNFAVQGTQQDVYTTTGADSLHRERTLAFSSAGLPVMLPLDAQCEADLMRSAAP